MNARRCLAAIWFALIWSFSKQMDERRTARVSEAIREELLEIVGFEMDDPRLRSIEISAVDVSQDARHAYVRVVGEG